MSSFAESEEYEPHLDFHKRFGASFVHHEDDDLEYGQDEEIETERTAALSTIERAAHEDTIRTLQEMFPSWSHNDLEALLSSCGDSLDAAVEEIVRLGEGGSTPTSAAFGDNGDDDGAEVDLGSNMTRMQLDDYERHVIQQLRAPQAEEKMTIAIAVPPGARSGGALHIRMVDGSKYTVHVPAGLHPGDKFLAEFPTAPMRQAALRRLTARNDTLPKPQELDEFLAVVEGRSNGEEVDEDEDAELKEALEQSLKENNDAAERRQRLQEEEDEQLKIALMQSEIGAEEEEAESRPTEHFF